MTRDEVQRLIDIIVQELAATSRQDVSAGGRCSCHAVSHDCCPTRLRGVVDAGASRIGVNAVGGAPDGIAQLIDHTLLKPDARRQDIEALCSEAAKYRFATVCVNPCWVALCSQLLAGTGVLVCSVVGFPLGATTADVKGYETRRAIFDGAREIDTVINVGALKSGDLQTVQRDIEAIVIPCRDSGVLSKVIIEAALLTDDEKVTACTLAKAAGGDGKGGCADPKTQLGYGLTHLVTNHLIVPTKDGAVGKHRLLTVGVCGNPHTMELQGGYEDEYVKTKDGWRFKSRIHVFKSAPSLQFGVCANREQP